MANATRDALRKYSPNVIDYNAIQPVIERLQPTFKSTGKTSVIDESVALRGISEQPGMYSDALTAVDHDKGYKYGAANGNIGPNAYSVQLENFRVYNDTMEYIPLNKIPAKFKSTSMNVNPKAQGDDSSAYYHFMEPQKDYFTYLKTESTVPLVSSPVTSVENSIPGYQGVSETHVLSHAPHIGMYTGRRYNYEKALDLDPGVVKLRDEFNTAVNAGYELEVSLPGVNALPDVVLDPEGPLNTVTTGNAYHTKDGLVPAVELADMLENPSVSAPLSSTHGGDIEVYTDLNKLVDGPQSSIGSGISSYQQNNINHDTSRVKLNDMVSPTVSTHQSTENGYKHIDNRHQFRLGVNNSRSYWNPTPSEGRQNNMRAAPQVNLKPRLNVLKGTDVPAKYTGSIIQPQITSIVKSFDPSHRPAKTAY